MKGDPRTAQRKKKQHLGQLAAPGLGGATSAAQTTVTVMLQTHSEPNDDCWLCSAFSYDFARI